MKKFVIFDLLCYAVLPYFIWNYGREPLGDYYAMLLSTVPGFIYTIYRFAIERQFNIAGLSILLSLFLSTMINLLSSNAENMLWNQVYLGYVYGMVFLISILIKKPLALQFAVDFVYLQGVAKEDSIAEFSRKGIFMWFQLLTLLLFTNSIFQNSLKAWLIQGYGVDGYGEMLIYMKISGWTFNILITAGFFFVGSKVNLKKQQIIEESSLIEERPSELEDEKSFS